MIDATYLKAHRIAQLKQRLRAGPVWEEHNLVFPNGRGLPLCRDWLTKPFRKVLQCAGLPTMRFHDLRHSCATLLAVANVPPKTAMEILGHTDLSMTLKVYTSVLEKSKRDALDNLDDLLGRRNAS